MRAVFSNLIEIMAHCEDCGWECETRNAQGLASQHAARTGHMVEVSMTRVLVYARPARWSMTPMAAKEAFGSGLDGASD